MKGSITKILFIFICVIFCAIFTLYKDKSFCSFNSLQTETETSTTLLTIVNNETKQRGNLNGHCQGEERKLCLPPFQVFDKRFRTSSKYKLNVCVIEKNLSTILTAILCFLYDEEKYIASKRNLNNEVFHHRFCGPKNEGTNLDFLQKKFGIELNEWALMAVVREPVERFISGFVDKCLVEKAWKKHPDRCNRCKTNVTCFIEKEYVRMTSYVEGAEINSFDDRHFFPQNWRCQFYSHFRRYKILHYSSKEKHEFFQKLYEILELNGVPKSSIDFVQKQLNAATTNHTTSGRQERQKLENEVRTNSRIMTLLTRMYYFDFLLFGFPLPEIPAQ